MLSSCFYWQRMSIQVGLNFLHMLLFTHEQRSRKTSDLRPVQNNIEISSVFRWRVVFCSQRIFKPQFLTSCRRLSRIRLKPLPVLMLPRHQLMPVDANFTHTKKVLEALCRHLVVGVLISLCLHMVTLHYSLISLLDCKSIVFAILKLTIST